MRPFRWRARAWLLCLATAVLFSAALPARAEILTSEGLDQVLAPIALYPDSLLGNVLVASTYPDQVVQASQWVQSHPGTSQEALGSALSGFSWDPSVKALAALPDVLSKMSGDMNWTVTLGTAFVDQPNDVYDSIQRLRAQAQATGALQTTQQVTVLTDDSGYILIGSTNPEYIYVPVYEPAVVYGWSPGRVVATTALVWGTTAILNEIFYGSCWNWGAHTFYMGRGYGTCGYWNGSVNVWGGGTNININNNVNINRTRNEINTNIHKGNTNWRPGKDPGGSKWAGVNGYKPGNDGKRPTPAERPQQVSRPDRPEQVTRPERPASAPSVDTSRLGSMQRTGSQGLGTTPFQRTGSGSQARVESARGRESRASSPSRPSRGGGGGGRRR